MRIRLLWVGKTKERWAAEAIDKYVKLIRPYAGVEIVEIKEEKGKSDAARALASEGGKILQQADSYVLLDERGRQASSVELAAMLKDRARMDFVIGGPWGVSEEVKKASSRTLSLSRMTLTHEMARILLMEQIYRGFTIITGREYHH